MKPSTIVRAALIGAAALSLGAVPAFADPGRAPAAPSQCFQTTEWQGWSSPSPTVLYLRVRMHDVYRVDLSAGSSELQWKSNHLISQVRGSTLVCSAIDLDLAVSDGNGFVSPLIAKSIRKLSPEEVAAIPKKDLP